MFANQKILQVQNPNRRKENSVDESGRIGGESAEKQILVRVNSFNKLKNYESQQRFNYTFLRENLMDLSANHDFLNTKIKVFDENNSMLQEANLALKNRILGLRNSQSNLRKEITENEKTKNSENGKNEFKENEIENLKKALVFQENNLVVLKKVNKNKRKEFQQVKINHENKKLEIENLSGELEIICLDFKTDEQINHFKNEENNLNLNDLKKGKMNLENQKTKTQNLKIELSNMLESLGHINDQLDQTNSENTQYRNLCIEFNRLRIMYTEKLNELVLENPENKKTGKWNRKPKTSFDRKKSSKFESNQFSSEDSES